jgi:hypothetical protein
MIPVRQDLTPVLGPQMTAGGPSGSPPSNLVYATYRGTGPTDQDNGIEVFLGTSFVAGSSVDARTGITYGTLTYVALGGASYNTQTYSFAGATATTFNGLAVDGVGNSYVVGTTNAPGNPVAFAMMIGFGFGQPLWATELGSPGTNSGNGIILDPTGQYVYLTGSYDDSPTGGFATDLLAAQLATANGLGIGAHYDFSPEGFGASVGTGIALCNDPSYPGPRVSGSVVDVDKVAKPFVVALLPNLDFDHGQYYRNALGGGSTLGIATDMDGYSYLTGYYNDPTNFGPDNRFFLVEWDPSVTFSFLGGVYNGLNPQGNFQGNAIAVAGALDYNNLSVYIAGYVDAEAPGSKDAVVARFDQVNYYNLLLTDSMVLGGSADDIGNGIAIDYTMNFSPDAFVAGVTSSDNFPVTFGAAQATYNGGSRDGFVADVANLI